MRFRFLIKGKKLAWVVVCGKSAGKMFAIEGSACFHPAENCHMEFQVIILSDKKIKKAKNKKNNNHIDNEGYVTNNDDDDADKNN